MQLFALTKEKTRREFQYYWNLQKIESLDELPKVGESIQTAHASMSYAMAAYDILHEDDRLDITQPYRIIVQAEGMDPFHIECEGDWAIAVLIYD
jgi:hypothetical protein